MAVTTYRFRWRGCDVDQIKKDVVPGVLVGFTAAFSKAWMDVTLDPGPPGSSAETDLNATMLAMGWQPFSTNPTTPLRAVTTKQELYASLAADAATASGVFVDLLTTGVFSTDTGSLDILATTSSRSTVTKVFFRILLDGVPVPGGGGAHEVGTQGVALAKRVAVAPGNHEVILQWRVAALGSAAIEVVTSPDEHHASLFVREVVS